MNRPLKDKIDRKYTWQDYLRWPDAERWEVIDGIAYDMTPSPTARHQTVVGNFFRMLTDSLAGGPCRTFMGPLDVYFDDLDFVQPDVLVVCDEKKIRDKIHGAPDLIIEVISPSTSLKDKREKKALYEKFAVREYIIAYPDELFLERYCLIKGKYREPDILGAREALELTSLADVHLTLWEIFEVEPPNDTGS